MSVSTMPTSDEYKIKELLQEKQILEKTNELLTNNTTDLENSRLLMRIKTSDEIKAARESEQEKKILKDTVKHIEKNKQIITKRYYLSIAIIAVIAASAFVANSYYQNEVIMKATNAFLKNYNSNYVIQNLKGDTIDTWISWRLADGRSLDVNIINKAGVSEDVISAIRDAMLSVETIELDDSLLHKGPQGTASTYYLGWKGALSEASVQPTEFYIPREFKIIDSPNGAGQVVITLVSQKDTDGYSGFTKSITDNNQILKSYITIYEADKITNKEMSAIIRHEFGHALGLAHSTAPEDLMAEVIRTDYPYISDCDIDAIKAVYDGKQSSQVVCTK